VTLAWQDSKTTTTDQLTSSQGASLEAGGNLTINAAGALNITGSTATAAYDTYTATSSKSSTQIGLTLSANENISASFKNRVGNGVTQ
jgi:hypothetical protein